MKTNFNKLLSVLAMACVVILTACGGGGGGGAGTGSSKSLLGITITPAVITVIKGKVSSFTATASYSDNTTADVTSNVTWTSDNSKIATIDSATGLATAATVGATTITATEPTIGLSTAARINVDELKGGTIQGVPLNLTNKVTTFAGSGTSAEINGTGTAASFAQPYGITSDGTNLYVTNTVGLNGQGDTIRKIEIATGKVTTLAGSGAAGATDGVGTAASFYYPQGITTDGTNLYVVEWVNNKVRTINIATGRVTTLAGSGAYGAADGVGTAASFNHPTAITTDGTNLYVADFTNYKIRKIVIATGVVSTFAGSGASGNIDGPAAVAEFGRPVGITTDGTNLYVTDALNFNVRKIVIATGVVSTFAGVGGKDITTDGTNLYVTNGTQIQKIVIATGAVSTLVSQAGVGITTDGTNLYIVDDSNYKILKIGGSVSFFSPTASALSSIAITPAAMITNTSAAMAVTQNQITNFIATATYVDGSTADITALANWKSSNTTAATINGVNGVATSLALGSTTITASQDGITSNSVTLSVVPQIPLISIAINQVGAVNPNARVIKPGGTTNLKATGTYADGSTADITNQVNWISANSGIASVNSASGVVTGVAVGSTTVLATLSGITSPATSINVLALMGGTLQGLPWKLPSVASAFVGGRWLNPGPTSTPAMLDGTGTWAGFVSIKGMTTDGNNLYVTDLSEIRKIVIATGVVTTLAGSATQNSVDGTGTAASFNGPSGITTDGVNLFVIDNYSRMIRKIVTTTGVVTTLAGSGVTGYLDATGTAAKFSGIADLTTDGTNLYVTDAVNQRIRQVVIATGVVTTLAGTGASGAVDGSGATASFTNPAGITTDGTNLYVADSGNNKIRKIAIATGAVTTLAGSGTAGSADGTGTAASFAGPSRIITDGINLYVSDSTIGIRKVVISTGAVTTLPTGTIVSTSDGSSMFIGDTGPGISMSF